MGASYSKTDTGATEVHEYSETSNHENTMEPNINNTSFETITLEASNCEFSNDANTIEPTINETSNDTITLEVPNCEISKDPNTVEPTINKTSNDTITLEAPNCEISKDPNTVEPTINKTSNDTITLEVPNCEISKDPNTVEPIINKTSNDTITLEAPNCEISKDPNTVEPTINKTSNDTITMEAPNGEISSETNTMKHTIDKTSNDTINVEALNSVTSNDTSKIELSIDETSNDTNKVEALNSVTSNDTSKIELSIDETSNDTNKVDSTIGEHSGDTDTSEDGTETSNGTEDSSDSETCSEAHQRIVDEVKDLLDSEEIVFPILEMICGAAGERERQLKERLFGGLVSEAKKKRDLQDLLRGACDMSIKLCKTREELGENKEYIITLEERLAYVEKLFNSTFIEIRNIPVKNRETKHNLVKLVLLIGTKIEMNMQKNDIKNIFLTTKQPDIDRGILVDFSTVMLKEDFLRMFNQHNQNKKKLTTHHLDLTKGPAASIVVVDQPPIEHFPTEKF